MSVLIAMPGPWLPESRGPAAHEAAGSPPAMPVLAHLLRRSRRLPDAQDWRSGVLAAFGGMAVEAAQVAARAIEGMREGAPLCMAAPLHVVAGISRVHLPPGGRLLLPPLEERAWCAAFNQEFGSPGVRLHVAAPGGGWLLEAPFAAAARDAAPDELVGEALARAPAGGDDERALRRLGAEVEMWLAAHALNREREARRLPPLNALWFWGGATAAPLPSLRLPRVFCGNQPGDAWLAGLARAGGSEALIAADWNTAAARGDSLLIVLAPDAAGQTRRFWEQLEADWIAPAAQALATGAMPALRLQVGASAWQLPQPRPWRWLRRNRGDWWQLTGQQRP